METQLTPEQLTKLLDSAKTGQSITLGQLAQILRAHGPQLEADTIFELLLNTGIKYTTAHRSLKEILSLRDFGRHMSLDEIVQIYQALDQMVTSQQVDAVANVLLEDLRTETWYLPAPLPSILQEYAKAAGQEKRSRKLFSALRRRLGLR